MSIRDFKREMGFENDYNDLDEMKDDIINHTKYFNPNFVPIPPQN